MVTGRVLFALALSAAAPLAHAGQLALAPATVSVDNTHESAEIVLTYEPGAGITDMESTWAVNLDRFGWSEVQLIPPSSPDLEAFCHVWNGQLRAGVESRTGTDLPSGTPIPLCRLRVRTHSHTPRGIYAIGLVTAGEVDFPLSTRPAASGVRIVVP